MWSSKGSTEKDGSTISRSAVPLKVGTAMGAEMMGVCVLTGILDLVFHKCQCVQNTSRCIGTILKKTMRCLVCGCKAKKRCKSQMSACPMFNVESDCYLDKTCFAIRHFQHSWVPGRFCWAAPRLFSPIHVALGAYLPQSGCTVWRSWGDPGVAPRF